MPSDEESVPPSVTDEEEEGKWELGGFKSTNLKHLSSIRTPSIPTQTVIFNKISDTLLIPRSDLVTSNYY